MAKLEVQQYCGHFAFNSLDKNIPVQWAINQYLMNMNYLRLMHTSYCGIFFINDRLCEYIVALYLWKLIERK